MSVKIKICGLSRPADIEAVNTAKPDYIGFVFAESKRKIKPEQAEVLRKLLSPDIIPVGVFVNEPAENIISLVRTGIIDAVQFHGSESEEYMIKLKTKLKAKSIKDKIIIKAVSVRNPGDAQQWENSCADYLLTDHKGGGTGERFDWDMIGEIKKPYFLAGGLDIANIAEAVKLKPFALDISSGVETNGFKDPVKIREFIRRIRNGY